MIQYISYRNLDDLFYFHYFFHYCSLAAGDPEAVIQGCLISFLSGFGDVVVTAQYNVQFGFCRRPGQFPLVRVDMAERQAQDAQLQRGLAKLQVAVLLCAGVDAECDKFLTLQNVLHQLGEDISGAEFYEDAAAGPVDVLDLILEKNRIGDLFFQNGVLLIRIIRIRQPRGVGINRNGRLVELLRVHEASEGLLCMFYISSMEGSGYR